MTSSLFFYFPLFLCGTGLTHLLGNGDEMAAIIVDLYYVYLESILCENIGHDYLVMSRASTNIRTGAQTSFPPRMD